MFEFEFLACKRKEEQSNTTTQPTTPKKPRLVFTDIQRRTLQVCLQGFKKILKFFF